MQKNELYENLKSKVVEVTFEKVNGDKRTMLCTLNEALIPEAHRPKGTQDTSKLSKEVQRVYDIEAEGWRSFRKESVIEWK